MAVAFFDCITGLHFLCSGALPKQTHNVKSGIFLKGKNDLKCAQIKHISRF